MKITLFLTIFIGFLLASGSSIRCQSREIPKIHGLEQNGFIEQSNTGNLHFAIMKDGADLIVLDGVYTEINERKIPIKGGYQLTRLKKEGGKWVVAHRGKPGATNLPVFNGFIGMDYNTFVRTSYGYVVCGPGMLVVFGNNLEPLQVVRQPGYAYLSAAPLRGTDEIALLKVSLKEHKVSINIMNYVTSEQLLGSSSTVMVGDDWLYFNAQSTRLIQTPEGQLFITLQVMEGFEKQIFGKFDLAKLREGKPIDEFMLWQKLYNLKLMELTIDEEGQMSAVVRLAGPEDQMEEKLQRVFGDTRANTAETFSSSLNTRKTEDWNQSPPGGGVIHRLPDGTFLVLGRGREEHHLERSVILIWYTSDMEVIRYYRVPRKYMTTMLDPSRTLATVPHQLTRMVIEPDGDIENQGLYCKPEPGWPDNEEVYFDYQRGRYSVWDFIPGFTKDEVILVTAHEIFSVNLGKYEVVPWDL